jgi:hypothetical protein
MSKTFNEDLTVAAAVLIEKGNTCPTAKEIAQQHFGRKSFPRHLARDVAKRLPTVKKRLETIFKIACFSVTEAFYADYKRTVPGDEVERKLCVAGACVAGRAAGIYAVVDKSDALYNTYLRNELSKTSGRASFNASRLMTEVEHKRLTKGQAGQMVAVAVKQVGDEKRKAFGKSILKALPPPEKA